MLHDNDFTSQTNKEEIDSKMKSICKMIRIERKKLNISSEKFAEFIGISVSFMGLIERGARYPSFATLFKVSKVLNIPLSRFFEDYNSTMLKMEDSENSSTHSTLNLYINMLNIEQKSKLIKILNILMFK